MRKRWLVGACVVLALGLAGKAATVAQREKVVMGIQVQQSWRSPGDPQSKVAIEPAAGRISTKTAQVSDLAIGDDPMGAVDSFLQRNRKDADDSIKALNQEAEALRARLQKVEAALARWQNIAAALNQEAGPDQEPVGSILAPAPPRIVVSQPSVAPATPPEILIEKTPAPPKLPEVADPTPTTLDPLESRKPSETPQPK